MRGRVSSKGRLPLPSEKQAAVRTGASEALAECWRLRALAEVVTWMSEGQPPLTKAELRNARRELGSRQR